MQSSSAPSRYNTNNQFTSSSLNRNNSISSQNDEYSQQSQRRPLIRNNYDQPSSNDNNNASSNNNNNNNNLNEETIFRDQNMAIRYRFFNRLDPHGHRLAIPDHLISSDFFSILPLDDFKDESGKQNSIVTIFSIWNTMMGSSLLAMPWAIQQAGFILGIFLILFVGALSVYTAYRIIHSPQGLTLNIESGSSADLSDVCRYFWGSVGETLSVFISVIVLIGSIIVYWILMCNFLYYTGTLIHDAMQPNSTTIPILENKTFMCDIYCPEPQPQYHEQFHLIINNFIQFKSAITNSNLFTFDNLWTLQGTVPIYLAIIILPLLSFKSATFFAKFNMLGTISAMYLMSFVASKAYDCGIHMNVYDQTSQHYAHLFAWRFPALSGTLTLSYFLHNVILTILRNQKYPQNNARDLTIGYSLAAFTYIFIGSLFFMLFPTYRTCISDNLLNNFGSGDVMSAIARLFLLFQMTTVLPLLAYLARAQFFYAILGTIYPGMLHVILLNIAVLCLAVSTAIFYPHVGSIIRFVGAFSGLVYIFALPCAIHLKRLQMNGKLMWYDYLLHGAIIAFGAINFILQFFL